MKCECGTEWDGKTRSSYALYPMCAVCGNIMQEPENDRVTCKACGYELDREEAYPSSDGDGMLCDACKLARDHE